jgi:hypothetical protein
MEPPTEPRTADRPPNPIGALYRRMSGWYVAFSIALALVILFVGYRLARPLLPLLLGE